MTRLTVACMAAVLGMASASLYAKEVDLTENDRLELRQRADSLRSSDMLGRDRVTPDRMRSADHRSMKHIKKNSKKHARRRA
jgi:hypothetical protein